MSSNLIFRVPGRTTNYLPIDINASRNEIMEKYARASFSTNNDWPHDSPYAGYYDVKNSDTKLILLNNQKKWSHLRGKTKSKRDPFKKDENYDWVEKEIEMKNSPQEVPDRLSPRVPDPIRHFSKSGCTYRYVENNNDVNESFDKLKRLNKSAVPIVHRKTMNNSLEKKEEERMENEILLKYLYAVGKRQTGFQGTGQSQKPPREFLSSYNINHPEFNKGQRLFLNELCNMYSVLPMKQSKQEQYIKLFQKQKESDQKHRIKYRMHDGENFELYKNWLLSERPLPQQVNCGYYKRIDTPINSNSSSSIKNLTSKSMINKPNSSMLSNSNSFASSSAAQFKKSNSLMRSATTKNSKIIPKLSSSSENSLSKKYKSNVTKVNHFNESDSKQESSDNSNELN